VKLPVDSRSTEKGSRSMLLSARKAPVDENQFSSVDGPILRAPGVDEVSGRTPVRARRPSTDTAVYHKTPVPVKNGEMS
jgi:hypothetical protein